MSGLARAAGAVGILSLLLAGHGCASAGGSAERESPEAGERGRSVVEVKNYNWSDVHVYVLAAGQRFSLGLVTSNSTVTFEIPRGAFSADRDLVFLADPVGSVVAYHSDPVLVNPGDRVEWTIHNNLAQSSISVF